MSPSISERRRAALVVRSSACRYRSSTRAAAEAHRDRSALLRRVAGDESLRAVFLRAARANGPPVGSSGTVDSPRYHSAPSDRSTATCRSSCTSCASISSGTLSLPPIDFLASCFAAAMRALARPISPDADLQDLLQREVARRQLEIDQLCRRTDPAGGSRRGPASFEVLDLRAAALAGVMPACMKMLPATSVTIGLPRSHWPYLPFGRQRVLVFDEARRMRRHPRFLRLRDRRSARARPCPSWLRRASRSLPTPPGAASRNWRRRTSRRSRASRRAFRRSGSSPRDCRAAQTRGRRRPWPAARGPSADRAPRACPRRDPCSRRFAMQLRCGRRSTCRCASMQAGDLEDAT